MKKVKQQGHSEEIYHISGNIYDLRQQLEKLEAETLLTIYLELERPLSAINNQTTEIGN